MSAGQNAPAAADSVETLKSCVLCGSNTISAAPIQPQPPYGLAQCNACGVIFLSPRPPLSEAKNVYDDFYDDDAKDTPRPRQYRRAKRHVRRLSRYALKPGKILEIGAGDGYFLSAAKESGWQVEGIEIAAPRIARAKEWFGIDLKNCDLLSSPFAPNSFDAIAMFQLIEHVHNPMAILKKANELLKPGGLLLLSTPNVLAHSRKKRDISSWSIPRHLFFFSPRTLVRAVEETGFKVVRRPLKFFATLEETLGWTPWPNGAVSRVTCDLWTPFGLNMIAKKM